MFTSNLPQSLVIAIASLLASSIAVAAAVAPAATRANPIEVFTYA